MFKIPAMGCGDVEMYKTCLYTANDPLLGHLGQCQGLNHLLLSNSVPLLVSAMVNCHWVIRMMVTNNLMVVQPAVCTTPVSRKQPASLVSWYPCRHRKTCCETKNTSKPNILQPNSGEETNLSRDLCTCIALRAQQLL